MVNVAFAWLFKAYKNQMCRLFLYHYLNWSELGFQIFVFQHNAASLLKAGSIIQLRFRKIPKKELFHYFGYIHVITM